jgi:hypothetical protein
VTDIADAAGPGSMVILIGGRMVVDDGSELDSRQRIDEDPLSHVMRTSLATSQLWWRTVESVVTPILTSAGEDAYALILGARSTVQLRLDGTLKRTRLQSFLPGGTTAVDVIWANNLKTLPEGYKRHQVPDQSWCSVAVKMGVPRRRWWFFNGMDAYIGYVADRLDPAVIIDTSDYLFQGSDEAISFSFQLGRLQQRRLTAKVALIMPHTYRAQELVESYRNWDNAFSYPGPENYNAAPGGWAPLPVQSVCPIPIEADFKVTGLLERWSWRDPADLEAARKLIQTRFDLKLGIWDLVRNPILCRTLLESAPVVAPPPETATIPAGAARRSDAKRATDLHDRKAQRAALEKLVELSDCGWEESSTGCLRRPLTDEFIRYEGAEADPLVWLSLELLKRQVKVTAFAILYNHQDIQVADYIRAREDTFRRIALPGSLTLREVHPVIWGEAGGWADEVDWQVRARDLARRTEAWIIAFQKLCDISVEVVEGKRPYRH